MSTKVPYILDLIKNSTSSYSTVTSTVNVPSVSMVAVPLNSTSSDVTSNSIKIPAKATSCMVSLAVRYRTDVAVVASTYGLVAYAVLNSNSSSYVAASANFTPFEIPTAVATSSGWSSGRWITPINIALPLNGAAEDGNRTLRLFIAQDSRNPGPIVNYIVEFILGNVVFFY